jgi:hypothetical protein
MQADGGDRAKPHVEPHMADQKRRCHSKLELPPKLADYWFSVSTSFQLRLLRRFSGLCAPNQTHHGKHNVGHLFRILSKLDIFDRTFF